MRIHARYFTGASEGSESVACYPSDTGGAAGDAIVHAML